jgi:coenzyme PQQ synthesis protein D (PqqD)
MDVASTEQFTVHPSVIARELSGETVLLNLESGIYYGLDAVGTRVWQLLVQGSTIAGVCETMLDEYEVEPDVLRGDVVRLVGDLRERGIVTPRESVQA